MHARIASLPGLKGPDQTRGITGLTYRAVKGVTRLVGGSVDALLAALTPLLAPSDTSATDTANASSREREAVRAALNGVLGDHLHASGNPLATDMVFCIGGDVLPLRGPALQQALPQGNGRLLVLLHGLCMNDQQWSRDGHDHGAALAREAGYTPVYLRYNTGRPVHMNGAEFAGLMDQLLTAWPHPLQRVVMLCHSMGGLVARSALHQGALAQQAWVRRVDDAVFLGTPHHGAPLERAGHGLDIVLGAAPYAAPLARLGRVRSAGITDLRHGRLLAGPGGAGSEPVPLPDQPRCYAVAASTGAQVHGLKGRLLGDGLVPVDSALGRHRDPARTLHFQADRQLQLRGVNHMQLLSSPDAFAALLRWLH
ncbi:MAG: esterase/lipase family protein [Aquabacterium sp.]